MSEVFFYGSSKDFKAIWNCNQQAYHVYYKDKFLKRLFNFKELETYLGDAV